MENIVTVAVTVSEKKGVDSGKAGGGGGRWRREAVAEGDGGRRWRWREDYLR